MKRKLVLGACFLAGIAAAVTLFLWVLWRALAPTSPQEEGGAIIFLRDLPGARAVNICRYDLATGRSHLLPTDEPLPPFALSSSFSPSPDGTEVVFVAQRNSAQCLLVLDAASGAVRDLVGSGLDGPGSYIDHVAWSPDGRRIAFNYRRYHPGQVMEDSRVYVIRPDGSDLREVAKWPPPPWANLPPDFAKADEVSLFVAGLSWWDTGPCKLRISMFFCPDVAEDGHYVIAPWAKDTGEGLSYLVEFDERDPSAVTSRIVPDAEEMDGFPLWEKAWSPDGQRFACREYPSKLYTVDADGVSHKRLVYEAAGHHRIESIAWSPGGNYLVFEEWGFRGEYRGLFIVGAWGGKPERVGEEQLVADIYPKWVAGPPPPDAP